MVKDHSLAGITCALKNATLGSISNPEAFHENPRKEKTCDPMVPELYALAPVRPKFRLIVADALTVLIEGGPRGNPEGIRKLHSVYAATDPVALDRIAWQALDALRKEAKLVPLAERPLGPQGPKGRPGHVGTAARLGLGIDDLARIDHQVVKL
jgi:uncharacterized protein (DUF362 family)